MTYETELSQYIDFKGNLQKVIDYCLDNNIKIYFTTICNKIGDTHAALYFNDEKDEILVQLQYPGTHIFLKDISWVFTKWEISKFGYRKVDDF